VLPWSYHGATEVVKMIVMVMQMAVMVMMMAVESLC
jgi:hypothetical protein